MRTPIDVLIADKWRELLYARSHGLGSSALWAKIELRILFRARHLLKAVVR